MFSAWKSSNMCLVLELDRWLIFYPLCKYRAGANNCVEVFKRMAAESPQVCYNRSSRACWCKCRALPLAKFSAVESHLIDTSPCQCINQIGRILFTEASQMNPEDADVHIVWGVLYNLSREFDRAITSFQTAWKLKPNDYSLWNKLGATQANSTVQSADAISAYQQVNCLIKTLAEVVRI